MSSGRPAVLSRQYLLSLPERVVRSMSGLSAGLLRELSEVVLPRAVRRTRLYTELVENTLRFLIENVGQVEGQYPPQGSLADNFAARRFAGSGVELVGLLTIGASPVWVLAALADLTGTGRQLIREIAQSLKEEGLLAAGADYETIDQLLDGLEGTAGRLAGTANTPPLDVASLRQEWSDLRRAAAKMPTPRLPSGDALRRSWEDLKLTAAAQGRPVFQVSTLLAVAAVSRIPENLLWLSRCAQGAARRTGQIFAGVLLNHYSATMQEIRVTGFAAYWAREFRPYLKAAASQFSPRRVTSTERLMGRHRTGSHLQM
ncbi:MAG TPA: hypothetical protein VMR62_06165 [Bryobacteraceae bacterium]|jgi:hypothetical protein|nr:hypothetical protein [Bryobacteraceae bacterium]